MSRMAIWARGKECEWGQLYAKFGFNNLMGRDQGDIV
jgi:hypothetical protein